MCVCRQQPMQRRAVQGSRVDRTGRGCCAGLRQLLSARWPVGGDTHTSCLQSSMPEFGLLCDKTTGTLCCKQLGCLCMCVCVWGVGRIV